MARIQILELPEGAADQRPPFALVIDQLPTDADGHVADYGRIADQIGARAVLAFDDTVDIPANEVPVGIDGQPLFQARNREETGNTATDEPVLQRRAERAEKRCEELRAESLRRGKEKLEYAERIRQMETALDEARTWARHGYEIGQRHCGWSDHGVAPAWLTEGWPRRIDSCEHLKRAAEYDEALTRVRGLPERPDGPDWPQSEGYLNGYAAATRAAKRVIPEPPHAEVANG